MATQKIEQATNADQSRNYEEALYLYQDGLRDFSQAADRNFRYKYQTNPDTTYSL